MLYLLPYVIYLTGIVQCMCPVMLQTSIAFPAQRECGMNMHDPFGETQNLFITEKLLSMCREMRHVHGVRGGLWCCSSRLRCSSGRSSWCRETSAALHLAWTPCSRAPQRRGRPGLPPMPTPTSFPSLVSQCAPPSTWRSCMCCLHVRMSV